MSSKRRLIDFIKAQKISKKDFLQKAGLSSSFLGSGEGINSEKIEKICRAFPQLSLDWLILNQGEMIRVKDDSKERLIESLQEELAKLKQNSEIIGERVQLQKQIITYQNALLSQHGIGATPPSV